MHPAAASPLAPPAARRPTCTRSPPAAHTGCCCVYSISSVLEGMLEPTMSSLHSRAEGRHKMERRRGGMVAAQCGRAGQAHTQHPPTVLLAAPSSWRVTLAGKNYQGTPPLVYTDQRRPAPAPDCLAEDIDAVVGVPLVDPHLSHAGLQVHDHSVDLQRGTAGRQAGVHAGPRRQGGRQHR